MSKIYVFADEAGCFSFTRKPNVSRYYVVCTVVMPSCSIGAKILELRRQLVWDGAPVGDYFHATTDKQEVRNKVFNLIMDADFTVQATIMEKSKAQPQTRTSDEQFYKHGWYFHFRYSSEQYLDHEAELMITVASIGTKRQRINFEDAVRDVVKQKIRRRQWVAAFWPCQTDPCLQLADYCTWAIQRKWERGDTRAYDLIKDRINYEYDLWQRGQHHYY